MEVGATYQDRVFPDDVCLVTRVDESFIHYRWLGQESTHHRSKDAFKEAFVPVPVEVQP